jgi:arabinofuranosyltransferase
MRSIDSPDGSIPPEPREAGEARVRGAGAGPARLSMRLGTGALIAAAVILHAAAIPIDFIDDAYISFRYAWHLSQGNGLVFNPGAPVEGYSNLTWVLIAAGLLKLDIPLEEGMRCAAVFFLATTPILIQASLLRAGASLGVASSAGVALALTTPWVMPMLNGLEGALFSFLLVCVTWHNWRSRAEVSLGPAIASGIAGLLLSATRPEGFALYLFQVGIGAALGSRTGGEAAQRPHLIALGTFLTGFVAFTAWRVATFGALIPNTVLAKMGSPYRPFARLSFSPWGDGLGYSLGFLEATLPLWILLALLPVFRRRRQAVRLSESSVALTVLAASLVFPGFAIVFVNNGDWMPDYRLLAPYIPLLVMAAGAGLTAFRPGPSLFALLGVGLLSLLPSRLERPAAGNLVEHKPSDFHRKLCALGSDTYAAAALRGAPVVAVEVLGVFSYCAPYLPLRDLNGLTDREIALHEPSSGTFGRKTSAATLTRMRPDIVMYSDLNYLRILLEESPWFAKEYLTLSCDRLFGDPLFIYYFVRRDSELAAPGVLDLCPAERVPPATAFKTANCLLGAWPYPFPRDCPSRPGVPRIPTPPLER